MSQDSAPLSDATAQRWWLQFLSGPELNPSACQFCNHESTHQLLRHPHGRGRKGTEAGVHWGHRRLCSYLNQDHGLDHGPCSGLQCVCGCPTCVPVLSGQERCQMVSTLQTGPRQCLDLLNYL